MEETKMNPSKFFVAVVLGLLLTCSSLPAQELTTGNIVGVVRDDSGALIPGASIAVTNKATGAQRKALSSEAGDFSVPGLSPALYDIRVEMTGFKAYVVPGLE